MVGANWKHNFAGDRSFCGRMMDMNFGQAVQWFIEWGFEVDLGPGPNELSLINKLDCGMTSCIVVPVDRLIPMAEIAREVRTINALFGTIGATEGDVLIS